MKIIKLCVFLLTAILLSCSVSPEIEASFVQKSSEFPLTYSSKNGVFEPENGLNEYDHAGWLHNAVFEAYYDGTVKDTSLLAIVEQVNRLANENSVFVGLSSVAYNFEDIVKARAVLKNPLLVRATSISASLEYPDVAVAFSEFLDAMELLCQTEADYGVIYAEVIAYEHSVLSDIRISKHDLEIILSTTSILRYSTCKRKKRPKKNTDPEWDLLIANVTGAVLGSSESVQEAVVLSLVAGIAANK